MNTREEDRQDRSKPATQESVDRSSDKEPKSIALKFVKIINDGNSEELIKLQTEDFTMVDAEGDIYRGRDDWSGYFSSYPEYKIHVQHVLTGGNSVAIIGRTTGSQVPSKLEEKETVLWTAEIRDGLVREWRIYSDIEEVKKKAQEKKD